MSTIGPDERDRILRKIARDAKEALIQSYTQKFTRAMTEYDRAMARSDAEATGKAFAEMHSANSMLRMIEGYEIK